MAWRNILLGVVLLLAIIASFMSGPAYARRAISHFLVSAFQPSIVDLGEEPDFVFGEAVGIIWPLPRPAASDEVTRPVHAGPPIRR